MENGGAINGENEIKTLNIGDRLDSDGFDAFSTPIKGDDSKAVAVTAEAEEELRRVKEEKIALEKDLQDAFKTQSSLEDEVSRLEGVSDGLRNDIFLAESAVEKAVGEKVKLQGEVDALKKALQEMEREKKEADEKNAVEREKLLGQIEALKNKLIISEEELIEIREKNATLEAEMGNSRESATVLAAQAHEEMVELMERNAFLEQEVFKNREIDEEDEVVVVKEVKPSQDWVTNGVCASAGAALAVVLMSFYFKLQKK